jgi:hypothetical protein
VRHQHDRPPLGRQLAQERQHLRAGLHVEVACRLVGQQHSGIVDEGTGDREALLLPTGELVRHRVGDVAQPEPVDQRAAAPERAGRGAGNAAGEEHVGLAAQLGQQVEELEDEADVPAAQGGEAALADAGDALAGHVDRARVRPVEAAEDMQERRLARPRAAEHGDDLTPGDVEVGPVEDAPRSTALPEAPDQPARAHDRHRLHGTWYAPWARGMCRASDARGRASRS